MVISGLLVVISGILVVISGLLVVYYLLLLFFVVFCFCYCKEGFQTPTTSVRVGCVSMTHCRLGIAWHDCGVEKTSV